MASFLRLCIHCAASVRFASVWDIPEEVICDGCKERIADNEKAAAATARKVERKKKVKREPSRSHPVPVVGSGRGRRR